MEPAVKRLFLELAAQNPLREQEESPAAPAPRFNEEDDAKLIDLVHTHPILWDSRRSDYSSNHKKSAAWKAISEEMDMSTCTFVFDKEKTGWIKRYLKRKFLNVYGRVKNAQLPGSTDSNAACIPEARLPWYINMSYLLPVADNPNPRTRNNATKKAVDEWNLSVFDNLFGNQSVSGDDTGDGVETTSNDASTSGSDVQPHTSSGLGQECQSDAKNEPSDAFASLFNVATCSNGGEAPQPRPNQKTPAIDPAAFQSLIEALAVEKHESTDTEAPDETELLLKQIEVDLRKLTTEKRDFARVKILTFLYELNSGADNPALVQHSSGCCPCVRDFVTRVQSFDAANNHGDLGPSNHC